MGIIPIFRDFGKISQQIRKIEKKHIFINTHKDVG
jgi:hypothetical protein